MIEQITVAPRCTTVYNFEVEDYHTYYVSNTKVLVHNNQPCKNVLPTLDATGKVHGTLPKVKDFVKYSKEELNILYGELIKSVQKRIKVTTKMGRDRGHGQRQGAEQDLIKSLENFLGL